MPKVKKYMYIVKHICKCTQIFIFELKWFKEMINRTTNIYSTSLNLPIFNNRQTRDYNNKAFN